MRTAKKHADNLWASGKKSWGAHRAGQTLQGERQPQEEDKQGVQVEGTVLSYHSVIESSKKHLRFYSWLVLNKASKIFQGIHWCLQLITGYWQEYKQ